MSRQDTTRIAPHPDAVVAALCAAVDEEPAWPPDDLRATVERLGREGEGGRTWHVGETAVRLAWWTDYLGRRHVRIRAVPVERRTSGVWVEPWAGVPPLLEVHPEAGFAVRSAGPADLLVVCPCGVAGRTDAVAWMGTECGPCHDRREAGALAARPWDAASRSIRHDERTPHRLSFLPDGRLLLAGPARSFDWDLRTGERSPSGFPAGQILASSADGAVAVAVGWGDVGFGLIHVVEAATGRLAARLIGVEDVPDHVGFSRSGRFLVVAAGEFSLGEKTLHVLDRRVPDAGPITFTGDFFTWALSPDEQALYVVDLCGGIRRCRLVGARGWRDLVPLSPPDDELRVVTGVHALADGTLLLAFSGGIFRVVDPVTGAVRSVHRLPGGETLHARWFLETAGSPSVLVAVGNQALGFVTLPGLGHPRILRMAEGPDSFFVAEDDHWLAVGDGTLVRVYPLPPLLAWYANEARQ